MDDTLKPQNRKKSGRESWKRRKWRECVINIPETNAVVAKHGIQLTEDSSHGQDEQLQQCVLFLVGQTQEAYLGHFGELGTAHLCTWREDRSLFWRGWKTEADHWRKSSSCNFRTKTMLHEQICSLAPDVEINFGPAQPRKATQEASGATRKHHADKPEQSFKAVRV